jgi:hypothetical protein
MQQIHLLDPIALVGLEMASTGSALVEHKSSERMDHVTRFAAMTAVVG